MFKIQIGNRHSLSTSQKLYLLIKLFLLGRHKATIFFLRFRRWKLNQNGVLWRKCLALSVVVNIVLVPLLCFLAISWGKDGTLLCQCTLCTVLGHCHIEQDWNVILMSTMQSRSRIKIRCFVSLLV